MIAESKWTVWIDSKHSPMRWAASLVRLAQQRNSLSMVRHIVAVILEMRMAPSSARNCINTSAAVRIRRRDDSVDGSTHVHVSIAPDREAIQTCAGKPGLGLWPFLLVPREQLEKARHLAEDQHVDSRLTIIAIEDFIAVNIIELSAGDQPKFVELLKSIVEKYNRRLEEVETDMSLRIEIQ